MMWPRTQRVARTDYEQWTSSDTSCYITGISIIPHYMFYLPETLSSPDHKSISIIIL